MFTPAESDACRRLIDLALAEDLGVAGDVTSQAVIPESLTGRAEFVARAAGVIAGLPAAVLAFEAVDSSLQFQPRVNDGAAVSKGEVLANVAGRLRTILICERTALNFLQRLSGIAALTRRYVDAVVGLRCRILDTRKTTPGWRLLEKYAVRMGGGMNHRMGLYDGVLIKDNHLAALRKADCGLQIEIAVERARKQANELPLEIEVDSLEQLEVALTCRPEFILLDNLALDQLREAVRRRNMHAPKVLLEASGGVTLENVRAVAETGVDRISVGALTHSAPALDIALDYSTS